MARWPTLSHAVGIPPWQHLFAQSRATKTLLFSHPAICVYCKRYQPQSVCFHCACLCARSSTVCVHLAPFAESPLSRSCSTAACARPCTEVPLVFVCVTLVALVPRAAARQRLLSLQPQKRPLFLSLALRLSSPSSCPPNHHHCLLNGVRTPHPLVLDPWHPAQRDMIFFATYPLPGEKVQLESRVGGCAGNYRPATLIIRMTE